MKSLSKPVHVVLAVALTLFLCDMSVCLAKGKDKSSAPTTNPNSSSPEIATLQQAYGLLKVADHDYKGHRVRAMEAIKLACDTLGADPKGGGKGDEPQGESDTQLRQADQLLAKVRTYAATQKQNQVLVHVDKAISEISLALSRN